MSPSIRTVRVRIPHHVVFRTFVSETVVLNVQTGRYHGLNPTAGRIMELFRELEDGGVVADRLAQETGETLTRIEQDLDLLCRDLAVRGLIEIHDGG